MVFFLLLKLECCGSSNYTDWEGSEWRKINTEKKVPLSCCKEGKNTSTCNNDTGFNLDNIHTKVMLWYSFLFTRSHARTFDHTILPNFLPRTSNAQTLARSLTHAHARTHLLRKAFANWFAIASVGYIYDNLVPQYQCVFGRGRTGLRNIFITYYVLFLLPSQGCLPELKEFVDNHLIILGIVAVSIAAIQVCIELKLK